MADKVHFAKGHPPDIGKTLSREKVLCGKNVVRNKQPAKVYRPMILYSTSIVEEVTCEGCMKNGRFPKCH